MFKIAIVEDNQTAMAKLQGYLERYAQENNENFDIAAFGDALAFLDSYRRIYDMVFMYRSIANRGSRFVSEFHIL